MIKYPNYLYTILLFPLLSGCEARCDIDQNFYATFSNSFATDISVEFRYQASSNDPYIIFNEIIAANETKSIFVGTELHNSRGSSGQYRVKVSCRDDSFDTNNADIQMSNSSLSQYTFCPSAVEGNGIDIFPMGTVCANQISEITDGY